MHRCYVPKEWIDLFLVDKKHPLPKEAYDRFFLVLRINKHEIVAVFDGCGREIIGHIAFDKKTNKAIFLEAFLREEEPYSPRIVLIQAALEESKITETIKRGCEYGVDEFIIFEAERSEKYCFNKLLNKEARLIRIAQDAARQSERLFIPHICFSHSLLQTLISHIKNNGFGIFGDVQETSYLSKLLPEKYNKESIFYIVVGPEGGLSIAECDLLKKNGFLAVRFAPYVLRTELAGLAAIAIFHAFCGRA